MKQTISIIIPVHNEQNSMPKLLEGLRAWEKRAEIILVDDGSTDRSAEIATNAGFRVIRHRVNKGYGGALKTGIRAAAGDIIVMMDADSEHNADDIERLLDVFDDNDMVVGARGRGSNAPLVRQPGKWLLRIVANYLTQTKIPDLNSGFRAIRKDVAKRFLHLLPNGFSFSTTITLALYKGGYSIAYVPIITSPRVGTSTVNPIKDGFKTLLYIVQMIALFDPLRVFIPTSIVLFLLGIGYWVWDIIARERINIPSGAIIVILASIIIFMFGILADQVSAIRREKYE